MSRKDAKDVSLADLKHDHYAEFVGEIYRFPIEVPTEYLQRQEPGPLMAFNVNHKYLYEFMLCAKRAYVNSLTQGIANVTVEIGEAYLDLALTDLRKVEGAVVLIPESEEQ